MTKRKMTVEEIKKSLKVEMPYLKEEFYVARLGIFGSFSKGAETKGSDIDMVVEFRRPVGLKFIDLVDYLENKLGRKIDMLTPAGIDSIRIHEVAENIRNSVIYV